MLIIALISLVSGQVSVDLSQPKESFRSFISSKLSHPMLKGESKLYNHQEIGTPAQNFSLIIDSGSSVIDKKFTWVEKFNCSECSSFPHQFDPSKSSTYASQNKTFYFSVLVKQYGDGSWANGTLSKDVISIGESNSLTTKAYFVLAEHDNMTSQNNADSPDGLLGLAFNTLSDGIDTLIDSLFKAGVIKKRIFALYLNRLGDIGNQEGYGKKPSSLEIGSYDIKKHVQAGCSMVTQDIEQSSGFWKARVSFEFMDLEIKEVPVIYDSGTTLVLVDQNTYFNIFEYLIESHDCIDYNLIICKCDSRNEMPSLNFYVKGHKLEIPADRAWYSEEDYCILLVQPGDMDFWILGSLFLQNFYTIHDMDRAQITFAVPKDSFSTLVALAFLMLIL